MYIREHAPPAAACCFLSPRLLRCLAASVRGGMLTGDDDEASDGVESCGVCVQRGSSGAPLLLPQLSSDLSRLRCLGL